MGSEKRHTNCRIQSLHDILFQNAIKVDAHAIFLKCFEVLSSYSSIENRGISLAFMSGFVEDFEEKMFQRNGISYEVCNSVDGYSQVCDYLDRHISLYILCDPTVIMDKNKIHQETRVGVCSAAVIIDRIDPDTVLCNQFIAGRLAMSRKVHYDVLRRAQRVSVLPSSPGNKHIYLLNEYNDTNRIVECLESPNLLLASIQHTFSKYLDNSIPPTVSNAGIRTVFNLSANGSVESYLKAMFEADYSNVSPDIAERAINAKLGVLRKSFLSGTSSFNRNELADALRYLYSNTHYQKLKTLEAKMRQIGGEYRRLTRVLFAFISKRGNRDSKDQLRSFYSEICTIHRHETCAIVDFLL